MTPDQLDSLLREAVVIDISSLDVETVERAYSLIPRLADAVRELRKELAEAREHLNTFCKCPTHGPSIIQVPQGEFE